MLHTGELVFCVRFRRWPEADFFVQPSVAGKGVCHLLNVQNLTLTHQKDLVNLIENLSFILKPGERLALIGEEGNGKSTLLREIHARLEEREDLTVFYMPQDPGSLLDMDKAPLEMLVRMGGKEEQVQNAVALGSMKFTGEEMNHPCRGLSGGQKAKLMFLMMAFSGANVLLLDEPTRNLSPLSALVVRALFAQYPGCIIAVSHDERLMEEVCTRVLRLTPKGMEENKIRR